MFRQGDIVLKRLKKLPKKAIKIKPPKLTGETGNEHIIEQAEWYGTNDQIFAVLSEDSVIKHIEHGTLNLDKGIYEISHLRDYVPKARYFGRGQFDDVYD
jgi:hypothetical protein